MHHCFKKNTKEKCEWFSLWVTIFFPTLPVPFKVINHIFPDVNVSGSKTEANKLNLLDSLLENASGVKKEAKIL